MTTDKTTFKAWFPEEGETSEDAVEIVLRNNDDENRRYAVEEAAERSYKRSTSIPAGGWTIAVLGPDDAAPAMFNVSIDWMPVFSAQEMKPKSDPQASTDDGEKS